MKSDLPDRTFKFATEIVKLYKYLHRQTDVPDVLQRQLLKAGTSIGANVHEGQSSQSQADFLTKYSIACKESRETLYWLRLINATDDCLNDRLDLLKEADELTAILTAIIIKVKVKKKK